MSDDLDSETVAILRRIKRDAEVHWIADRAANSIERLTAEVAAYRLADEVARKAWVKLFPMRLPTAPLVSIVTDIEAEAARLRDGLEQVKKHIGPGYEYATLFKIVDTALRGEEG